MHVKHLCPEYMKNSRKSVINERPIKNMHENRAGTSHKGIFKWATNAETGA